MTRTTDPVYLAAGYALVACRVCERPLRITQGEFGWESYDGEGEPDLDEWQCAEPCESEPGDAQEIQADAVWESSR